MGYSLYTRAFGSGQAEQMVLIKEKDTGVLAVIYTDSAGTISNNQGQATLDINGILSVYLDNSKTWVVQGFEGTPLIANGSGGNSYGTKAFIDASYFGFVSGPLTSPTNIWDLIAAAPDCSAACRALEDYFMNWREKTTKPVVVRFPQGVFRFDAILFQENSDVFYQRSGLVLEGAGSAATVFGASVSDKAQFIGIAGKTNWVSGPVLRGVTLYGAGASNPNQVGVFLAPEFVNTLGFGGNTGTHWKDVQIKNFAREQLWLKGGGEDYNVPFQYGIWEDIVCTSKTDAYPAVRLTGQLGPPFNFDKLQAYGAGTYHTVTTANVSTGATSIPVQSTYGVTAGMSVIWPGLATPKYVTAVASNSVSINTAITGSETTLSGTRIVFGSEGEAILRIGFDTRTGIKLLNTSASTGILTFNEPHRLITGDRFVLNGSFGGLTGTITYFAYKIDDYKIKVCSNYANATANPPTFVSLTTQTANVSSPTVSINQGPGNLSAVQVVFDTPTLQGGSIGVSIDSPSLICMSNLHVENTKIAVKIANGSNVSILNATLGDAGLGSGLGPGGWDSNPYAGALFYTDGHLSSSIILDGSIAISGVADAIAKTSVPDSVKFPKHGFTGSYIPTVGNGVAYQMLPLQQLGNATELDIRQRINGEYLLNTGTNVIRHIRGQVFPGSRVTFNIWYATGVWLEFGTGGNIDLREKAFNGNTLRIPRGSIVTFIATALNQGWILENLIIPVEKTTWTLSGSVNANTAVSTTVTCDGARVGDLTPTVSLSTAIPAGLLLTAEITAANTATVKLINITSSAVTLPTDPVIYIKQNR